jgi:sortase A
VLDAVGRVLIACGLLLLSFTAYQLWGTGIEQARSQRELERQFERTAVVADTTQQPGTTSVPRVPVPGDSVGRVEIPSLGVKEWMVAGARLSDLEKGPGVFAGSVLPGQTGNLAVAGHRTSYGAPFGDLDKLREGDDIIFTTAGGSFTYEVTGSRVVPPTDVGVLAQTKDSAIATLVTCHPKWTSGDRLIVTAELAPVHEPAAPTPIVETVAAEPEQITPGWWHDRSRILPTLVWSGVLLAIWVAARRLSRGGLRRRAGVWAVAAVPFLPSLYMMFKNLSGLLPANL